MIAWLRRVLAERQARRRQAEARVRHEERRRQFVDRWAKLLESKEERKP